MQWDSVKIQGHNTSIYLSCAFELDVSKMTRWPVSPEQYRGDCTVRLVDLEKENTQ